MTSAGHMIMLGGGASAGLEPLCFTAPASNSVTISMSRWAGGPEIPTPSLEYSFNGFVYSPFVPGETTISLDPNQKAYVRATSGGNSQINYSTDVNSIWFFSITDKCAASGNIMSLLGVENLGYDRSCCFAYLFSGCPLTTAPKLPSVDLSPYCYEGMFGGDTYLTEAPDLPAEALLPGCYNYMFAGCSALQSVKALFTEWKPTTCTVNWLESVNPSGVFKYVSALGLPPSRSTSTIPEGWTPELIEISRAQTQVL